MTLRTCDFDGCEREHAAKGLCNAHWNQQQTGTRLRPIGTRSLTAEDRFWAKVDKGQDCWLWTATKTVCGYGQFFVNRRKVYAHRFAYELLVAEIPTGLETDHLCWTRNCVNPAHIRLVTHKHNAENKRGAVTGSTTGVRGVQWHKGANKYVVQVSSGGVRYHGGLHLTLAEAEAAAIALRCRVMTHNEADRRTA